MVSWVGEVRKSEKKAVRATVRLTSQTQRVTLIPPKHFHGFRKSCPGPKATRHPPLPWTGWVKYLPAYAFYFFFLTSVFIPVY